MATQPTFVQTLLASLLNSLVPTLEAVGEAELGAVLQKLHDTNPTGYLAALEGGNAFVKVVGPLVTGNPVVVGIIAAIQAEIVASAAANNVTL